MGAVVIYAMAKNARGNGGKRASKTKPAGVVGDRAKGFLRSAGEREKARARERREREREKEDARVFRTISRVTNLYGIV